jgi:ABC-2 type transport system permease protein
MLKDDLRCILAVLRKDLRAYYFKPPNISWGIIFPFAFVLAFVIREGTVLDRDGFSSLVPGLLAMTMMFGTSSMEAIVITFERRIGALERLLLAPMHLSSLLVAKLLGGMIFGLATTVVAFLLMLVIFGTSVSSWWLLLVTLLLTAAVFSALGVLISVSVNEVFEAQTLANALRFPMMFLCGVFVSVRSLPLALRVVAHALPLTYAVDALNGALVQGSTGSVYLDLLVLACFTTVFFGFATRILSRRIG